MSHCFVRIIVTRGRRKKLFTWKEVPPEKTTSVTRRETPYLFVSLLGNKLHQRRQNYLGVGKTDTYSANDSNNREFVLMSLQLKF